MLARTDAAPEPADAEAMDAAMRHGPCSWRPWSEIPGSSGMSAAAITAISGAMYVTARSAPGELLWTTRSTGGVWEPWRTIAGGAITAQPPALVHTEGHLHAFMADTERKVRTNAMDMDTLTWGQWAELNTGGTSAASPTAAILGTSIYAVARGPNGNLWLNTREIDATLWAGWAKIPQVAPSNAVPAATADEDHLYLFSSIATEDGMPVLEVVSLSLEQHWSEPASFVAPAFDAAPAVTIADDILVLFGVQQGALWAAGMDLGLTGSSTWEAVPTPADVLHASASSEGRGAWVVVASEDRLHWSRCTP